MFDAADSYIRATAVTERLSLDKTQLRPARAHTPQELLRLPARRRRRRRQRRAAVKFASYNIARPFVAYTYATHSFMLSIRHLFKGCVARIARHVLCVYVHLMCRAAATINSVISEEGASGLCDLQRTAEFSARRESAARKKDSLAKFLFTYACAPLPPRKRKERNLIAF